MVSIEINAAFTENFHYFVHVVFTDHGLLVLPQNYIFVTGMIDDLSPDRGIVCRSFLVAPGPLNLIRIRSFHLG